MSAESGCSAQLCHLLQLDLIGDKVVVNPAALNLDHIADDQLVVAEVVPLRVTGGKVGLSLMVVFSLRSVTK